MQIRLFLGLKPDLAQIQALVALQQQLAGTGRPVPADNLHMTLFFLGTIEQNKADIFVRAIDSQIWPSFSVTLDQLSGWQKPKILCLAGSVSDEKLSSSVANIRAIAKTVALQDPFTTYTPHITLMRKAIALPDNSQQLLTEPLVINPDSMHLFQSISRESGVEYQIIKSWPLRR
ncbi:MAG: hypothetical protein OFPI_40760 [Osedax symbiont Rs2]|nr:MAG: hypothetical protein OFPI_40760 [Osedax symbiont Rs2]